MTTENEKTCIQLIFAALDSAATGKDSPEMFKISMALGVAVHLAVDHGIDEKLLTEWLQSRYAEYLERVDQS